MGHKNARKKGAGKLEHEYFRDKIIKYYEHRGFKTEPEKRTRNGHCVDVVARKGSQKVAVEVETGDSDIRHNIEADLKAGFGYVLSVPTNSRAERKTQELVAHGNSYPGKRDEAEAIRPDAPVAGMAEAAEYILGRGA